MRLLGEDVLQKIVSITSIENPKRNLNHDNIPKGASRGAATPIGALLRKDMSSVCIKEAVM